MESLLRSKEMDKIEFLAKRAYDLNSNIVYFPVRHHSPACSYHLKKVIGEYEPEIILIEGPSDAGEVIKYLSHEESRAPFCIYYSYFDKKSLVDENRGRYTCYYPFLDFSPELVAIREAKGKGIPSEFIDLPYPEILINSERGWGIRKDDKKNSYNDDYLLQRSSFIKLLCEKEGCRNYDELWEKLFEIDGINIDTYSFIKNMIASCYLSRVDYNEEMLKADGCLARELFMAERIREALKKYNRVLVVTGGFHTPGLLELSGGDDKIKLHNIEEVDFAAYPMAYSFEESDLLSGYASGMPHPAFYQEVWENILDNGEKPYERAVLNFIVRCGGSVRKKEGGLSTADEIEAFNMARGLKSLRSKAECGVYELMDSARASFIKGELSPASDMPLRTLLKLITGRKTGKITGEASIPPILMDFKEKLDSFKLKANTTAEQEIVLDIYKNKKHRSISSFFHIMRFLDTGFCKLIKGPDYSGRKNMNLVRETWRYKWSAGVESRLIELSVNGGTLKEGAESVLLNLIKDETTSGEASKLLIDGFLMELDEILLKATGSMKDIIIGDNSFFSLADCTYNLNFLLNAGRLLGLESSSEIAGYILLAYNKAVSLIPGLYNISKDEEDRVVEKLKDMYQIASKAENGTNPELLAEALLTITNKSDCSSAVEGASLGLLLGFNRIATEDIVKKAEGYLYGTGEKFLSSGGFLKGLFSTSRDVVLSGEALLDGIDNVVKNIEEENFLKILPDLKIAFSFFIPSEIDDIGKKVSGLYGISKEKVLKVKAVNSGDIEEGIKLDSFGTHLLREWGLANE